MERSIQGAQVRFAVVGLGHIAQAAVLPAFENAENCELSALVSGDDTKLEILSKRYGTKTAVRYDGYDELLRSGQVDAVYLAVPNHLHSTYAIKALERGVHVLCEKPMAPTEQECLDMLAAARTGGAHLMIAYRVHFEHVNLRAIRWVQSGMIGEPRIFSSVFSQTVREGNVRLMPIDRGGGTVFDLGVYCINAARNLFGAEPSSVFATSLWRADEKLRECDLATNALLEFPRGARAQFCSHFAAHRSSDLRIVGTEGEIQVHNAYEYAKPISCSLTRRDGERRRWTLPQRDQFGPQLYYFATCIQANQHPEPDGFEGLADVRVVQAIYQSARTRKPVAIEPDGMGAHQKLSADQAIRRPSLPKPDEVHASGPTE